MDFISLSENIADSRHPYIAFADDTDSISQNPWFFWQLRQFLDLGIDNEAFFSMPCLMYFLELTGLQIPPIYHELVRKPGHEDDCLEDCIEAREDMDHFEHSMRAYLAAGTEIYDTPLTVYQCNSIEDVCIASLHFLIVNQHNIRKCKNCGRYFVAYLRSDAEYCTRVSPYNKKKTCREDGPKGTFEASINADVVKRTLKQIESARRMRKHRNPDNWDIQTEFDEWHTAMVAGARIINQAASPQSSSWHGWKNIDRIPRTGITKKTIFDENSARLITVRNPFNFDLILTHVYLISVCEFYLLLVGEWI